MDETLAKVVSQAAFGNALTPNTEEYLRHLLSLHAPNAYKRLNAVQYGGESKQVHVEIEADEDFIELVEVADVQWGHKACKYEEFSQFIDWILLKPNRYLFLVGDMIDAAHAFTPGTPFDNLFAPNSQSFKFSEMMARVRHRVLGYVGGNHERRGIGSFGDLGVLLAILLQVPYSGGRQYVHIDFGKHEPFRTLLWHGNPRARTEGALAQIMSRFMRIGREQLYITAHNHQSLVLPRHREIVKPSKIERQMYVGMTCTSFLETFGTYAEWMGFEAYETLMPRVRLFKDGEWEAVIPSRNR